MREQQSKKELGSFQRSCRFPQEKISRGMLEDLGRLLPTAGCQQSLMYYLREGPPLLLYTLDLNFFFIITDKLQPYVEMYINVYLNLST